MLFNSPLSNGELIALLSLCVTVLGGLIAGGWKIIQAFRNRNQTKVECFQIATGIPSGTETLNRYQACVRVTAVRGSTSIHDIGFEWEKPETDVLIQSGAAIGTAPKVGKLADPFASRVVLQEGESDEWLFRFNSPSNHDGVGELKKLRAVVALTSGKKVRSDFFYIAPDLRLKNGERPWADGSDRR